MTLPCRLGPLTLSLCLSACATAPAPQTDVPVPRAWQGQVDTRAERPDAVWWRAFGSPELERLVTRALANSQDLAAAVARVRQAQARATIAGAPLLPEVQLGVDASRQRLLRGEGYDQLDVDRAERTSTAFTTRLSARYEVDFWGGLRAAQTRAVRDLEATRFDRQTVELTLLAAVADGYLQCLALNEQARIAQLNLDNARDVLAWVQTRQQSGSATALEVAQQHSLVAAQARQLARLDQRLHEARIVLATLLGDPVQALPSFDETLATLHWPRIDAGLPSDLLVRRPDIAAAEARLAAASANVQVARAAMLPQLVLGAELGSGARTFADVMDSPYYTLTAGLLAPVFDRGRLRAGHTLAKAEQEELLHAYGASLLAGFADVEQALNAIDGVEHQRRWQDEQARQAQIASDLAQQRYAAGAETLLTVLDTQRTLYQAQDEQVQLRLARLQGAASLYKALGGGWSAAPSPSPSARSPAVDAAAPPLP